eukprot:gene16165-biopygen13734
MDKLEKAKRKRKSHRGTATKLMHKIEDVLGQENKDKLRIEQCLADLKEKAETLKVLDNEIFDLIIESADEDACDKEADEASEIKEKITYTIVTLENALKELDIESKWSEKSFQLGRTGNLSRSASRESINSVASSIANLDMNHRRVKLPKLELKKFGGKIAEWPEFWDGFRSAIHEDSQLAKVDKFKYLKSFLEEPARSVVSGFPLTDADYDSALELLKGRYAKPSVIKRAHINDLINLAPVYNEKSVQRLRHLHDQIETRFRAMEAQHVNKESYSSVVVPILLGKVPESLRNNMIRFGSNHMEWNLDDMLGALAKELEVLEGHFPIMQQAGGGGERRQDRPRPQQSRPSTASALFAGHDGQKKCAFCQEEHSPENCTKIKDVEERKHLLIKSARCFSCLKPGHRSYKCRNKISCNRCKEGNHHCAICPSLAPCISKDSQPQPTAPVLDPTASAWVGNTGSEGRVALQTALAVVNGTREGKVRVLFDTGSHKTFITAKAVSKLGLRPVRTERLGIKAFGSTESNVAMRDVVRISLGPSQGGESVSVEAFVVKDIASIPNIHIEVVKSNYSHLSKLWFSDVSGSEDTLEVDCLIGSDWLWQFQKGETIRGGPEEPVAVKTSLGWVISGPLKGEKLASVDANVNICVDSMFSLAANQKDDLDTKVQKLWDLDSLGIREGNKVHENVLDNISFTGGRYSVGLPWKLGHKPLGSNYNVSLQRLKGQVKKLEQSPTIYEQYNDIISQQAAQGIIERVTELEATGTVHYLPHRAVVRENAETTKVRVVYDASSKNRKSDASLNDCLHVGPALTPLIFDVLLRFRTNPVALVGDIEKAFLNIEIHPKDRDCLRFLWLKDIHSKNPEVVVYRFNRVVFGCNSSPFLLNCVLRHHIQKYEEEDPDFVSKMIGGFFVDDLVTGCENTEKAVSLYERAKERMKEGGFHLRKWKTNDRRLAREIAVKEEEGVKERITPEIEDTSYVKETLGAPVSMGEKTKVLGITWDNHKDTWEFNLGNRGEEISKTVPTTKRGILSALASIFDPHGLVSPIAVSAKILFQELCLEKLGWDDPIPSDKSARWEEWLKDLKGTGNICIPRCVVSINKGTLLSRQLHGFADASQKAYCGMIYLVEETTEGTFTRLLCAKTRVAPLKELSIPRLELMSARVLATLMNTAIEALGPQFKIDSVRYWLDSKTALYWINNNGEWKQFVQHRVNEILGLTKKEDWGHVAGIDNPADLGSRGAKASHLKGSELWWQGPEWLRRGKESWPKGLLLQDTSVVMSERKKNANVLVTLGSKAGVSEVVKIDRHSTLSKLLRVTAYVQRFIANLRELKAGRRPKLGALEVEEMERAERLWIKDAQDSLRGSDEFEKLSVQLGVRNEDELLVCKGRLGNADFEYRRKHPILLPKQNAFTDLVIYDCHARVHHNKLRSTLTELRGRFWVPRGRQQVKRVVGKCQICKRLEGKAFKPPPTTELPSFRVTETLPFSNTGVDFAGPLYVKNNTGEMVKVYITLFTCCVTRAVHLELISDLQTSTFVNCLRRFCARRGTPRLINTDNGLTFKAADSLLKKLKLDHTFQGFLDHHRITWKFNLPLSPWWGGYFERMVGSVKRCLRKVLGNARLSFDELSTILTEVESTLNSRPLTYLYDELGDVLTPSHLLYGHRFSSLSEGIDPHSELDESDDKVCKRFLYLTKKLSHFWNRWRKEYLTDLREFHKMSNSETVPVKKGDLVLLREDNVKRGQWKVAIVEEIIYGKDREPRGATVRKYEKGKPSILNRPLQRLYPLEISCNDSGIMNGEKQSATQDGESNVGKENESRRQSSRVAAKDARWKSKLMLDP